MIPPGSSGRLSEMELSLHEKFVLCISSNMYQIYGNACVCNYFYIFAFHLLKFDSRLPIINDQIYVGAHT